MNNRLYNIFFHTHTISGIIISAILYVIFFAGSFAFFRDEIVNWERNHTTKANDDIELNFSKALEKIDTTYNLYGRDIELKKYYQEQQIGVYVGTSQDTISVKKANETAFFYIDTQQLNTISYEESYSLGEFLYRLHFLAQVPYPIGYYLSGFIALFFLFAIITGILIHWKKIISNFYVFRPLAKIKTLWSDAHTALGVVGIPFQFVYAVTGAFFMIKALLIAPSVLFLYNGDEAKFYEDLGYAHPHFEFAGHKLSKTPDIQKFTNKTKEMWPGFEIGEIHMFNYNDTNMHVLISGHLPYKNKYNGVGEAIYKVSTGELVSKKDPTLKTTYLEAVKNIMYRIHYGDYGGYLLKIISFILGLITCFVIISGIMIWLVARDKKHISEQKRKFNYWLVTVYLAICLGMYPVTAFSFIAVKFMKVNMMLLYNIYFLSWLVVIVCFIIKKEHRFILKYSLLSGAVLGFLIPIVNGFMTSNWIWKTISNHQYQILFIDMFWLILSLVSIWIYIKLKRKAIV